MDDEEDKEDVVKSQSPVEDERRRVQVEEEEEDEDDEHDHRLATVHTPGKFRMRFGWCWYSGPILQCHTFIDRTVLTGIPLTGRHGEVLWEREAAGLGLLGAASSESTAGSGRLRACGRSCGC